MRRKRKDEHQSFGVNRILLCFEFWPILLRCGRQRVAGQQFIAVPQEITSPSAWMTEITSEREGNQLAELPY